MSVAYNCGYHNISIEQCWSEDNRVLKLEMLKPSRK